MSHPETVPVEQVDREAAAAYYYSAGGSPKTAREICEGNRDNWFRVQAFARHRLTHAPSYDADVVERVAETIRDEVRHRLSIVVKDGEATARRVGEIITSCCHSINWSPRFRAAIRAMQKEGQNG